MIKIEQYNDKIIVKGHAGYAENGKDIVCAAISTLLQAFIASVEELTTDNLECVISAGNAVIRYKDLSEQAQLLMKSFFISCQMIADSYPIYVKVQAWNT